MSPKATWYWLLVAGVLFAFIFFYQRHVNWGPAGPEPILNKLDPAAVTFVQVRSGVKGDEIVAERTNNSWMLLNPLVYPAQNSAVEKLLTNLVHLTAATYLSESELRSHPNADEDFGLLTPQASLIITQENYRAHILLGAKTAPGDQLFLRVVASEGLYVVDADLLKVIPRSANDWRDRDLVHLAQLDFDRVAVTNNGKSFVLRQESTNGLWRMVWPLFQARADGARIAKGLRQLASMRVQEFITDDPKADLDGFGLQTPNLELGLARETNSLALFQFGKSPTNHPDQVYARCSGQTAIVTVSNAPLAAWQVDSVNAFRDPHLLDLLVPVSQIKVSGEDEFTITAETNGCRVQPRNFAADEELVSNLLLGLTNMPIVQFTKDVATPLNWPEFGLASPARRFVLETAATNVAGHLSNDVIVDLNFGFGTNQSDKVFVRRADEASIYAVSTNDFAQLPAASWQLRERRFWIFSVDDIKALDIHERGKVRQLLRRGDHAWTLGPGSQGIIDEAAIEESVRNLLGTPALDWVGIGETNRARFGFSNDGLQITFQLKNGQKTSLEIGGESTGNARYAAVTFEGEPWFLELPYSLYRYIQTYLSLPAGL